MSSQLHWTQRVALVRHNLHSASRSGDFHFFKTLQAAGFMEGTNHVATLSAELGDDADVVLAAMDNLNAGLAYVYQDAFKTVYENLKNNIRDGDKQADKSKLYVDITTEKNKADVSIDKMVSSALAVINQQPANVQESTANVWITGSTIIADSMEISLQQLDLLEDKLDDFIRLEESWNTVKASVVAAVTGLKGVFHLMDSANMFQSRAASSRSSSIASAGGAVFRRLSNAFVGPSASSSRSNSIAWGGAPARNNSGSSNNVGAPVFRTTNYKRNSLSSGMPDFNVHKLSMIPQTPAALDKDQTDPFDTSIPPVPEIPSSLIMTGTLNIESRRGSLTASIA